MLRDSRIVHIIDLLGELRELLLVIDQAGDTAPAILLKLAKEKAEEITRLTRELRQPEFWDGILRYDPFTSVKTTTHEDAIPSMENPLEKVGEPVSSHITDENIIPTEKQSSQPIFQPSTNTWSKPCSAAKSIYFFTLALLAGWTPLGFTPV